MRQTRPMRGFQADRYSDVPASGRVVVPGRPHPPQGAHPSSPGLSVRVVRNADISITVALIAPAAAVSLGLALAAEV
jgi:hypothetical protein